VDNPSIYVKRGNLMESVHPVVGIDVAKDFCYYCFLTPAGKIYREPFKANNDESGLRYVVGEIKKVEKEFGTKPVIILESTGHYSNPLVHFFTKKDLTVFLVNPLQSHSIKNSQIRKVKNDKVDAEELARLYFLKDLKAYEVTDEKIENLKVLSRAYFHMSEQRVSILNQLVASIEQVMPQFTKVFKNVSSKTALELLTKYPSHDAILKAPKEDITQLIKICSRKPLKYAQDKYEALVKACKGGKEIGISRDAYYQIIKTYADMLKDINAKLDALQSSIIALGKQIPSYSLLTSIPGIGEKLAAIIISEIGSIDRFEKAKQLVAYCGIDPSVRQSGNFVGTKNKLTKRGSSYIRRALYIAAVASVRQYANGTYLNKVIYDYYQSKIQGKPKKQALGAVMNKLVRIIFSVLKNNREFVLITPQEQAKMYKSNLRIAS